MAIPTKDAYPENVVNPNFQNLLDKFHKLIEGEPKPEKIKDKLLELKSKTANTHLTGHQKDAIGSRVNNYLNGTFRSWSVGYKVHVHTKSEK